MEDYAAKMELKSDAALRAYVTDYAQYRDEAVLAALSELRRRGHPAPEEAELRPLLEAAVQQQAEASRQAQVAAEEPTDDLPALYSPVGILVISATVSVVAGAVLLALNLQRLKRTGAIVGLIAFVLAYLVAEVFVFQWLMSQRLLSPMVSLLLDVPLMLAYMWWFWPRYVRTYEFKARNWLLPLGICVLLKVGLALLVLNIPGAQHLLQQQVEQLQRR